MIKHFLKNTSTYIKLKLAEYNRVVYMERVKRENMMNEALTDAALMGVIDHDQYCEIHDIYSRKINDKCGYDCTKLHNNVELSESLNINEIPLKNQMEELNRVNV